MADETMSDQGMTPQELRFLAIECRRNYLDGTKLPSDTGDKLILLADWLEALKAATDADHAGAVARYSGRLRGCLEYRQGP